MKQTVKLKFPMDTFIVNVVGCLIAGLLAGLVTNFDWFSADTRLLLFSGLLEGFITISAFGVETVYLLRRAEYAVAIIYFMLGMVVGISALTLGIHVARTVGIP